MAGSAAPLDGQGVGGTDWVGCAGTRVSQKMLRGLDPIDGNLLNLATGRDRAATLRTFDSHSAHGSVWWLDGRHPGQLDSTVVGPFQHFEGTFCADDRLLGQAIRVVDFARQA